VVIPGIEFEGALVIEGIEILKVREFRRNGNLPFLICLTIQYLNLMTGRLKRGSKISQSDRLGADGRAIKITDGGLDEQDLHNGLFIT
jgi:hypothetical protein